MIYKDLQCRSFSKIFILAHYRDYMFDYCRSFLVLVTTSVIQLETVQSLFDSGNYSFTNNSSIKTPEYNSIQSSQYCMWSRVSESPSPNFNCLKISNNTLRRWFLAATWQATLSAIFDSGWQEMAVWLRTIPIPLLGHLIFFHWVPCRIWHKHNTTSQNET